MLFEFTLRVKCLLVIFLYQRFYLLLFDVFFEKILFEVTIVSTVQTHIGVYVEKF